MNNLNLDICNLIASFVITPKYILLEWINKEKLFKCPELSQNKNAISFLQNNQDFRVAENKIETLKNGTFSNSRLSRATVLSNSMWSILTTALDCHNPI
jgi:hypothetical protein